MRHGLAGRLLGLRDFTLGLAAASMIALGYTGEIQDDQSQRFIS